MYFDTDICVFRTVLKWEMNLMTKIRHPCTFLSATACMFWPCSVYSPDLLSSVYTSPVFRWLPGWALDKMWVTFFKLHNSVLVMFSSFVPWAVTSSGTEELFKLALVEQKQRLTLVKCVNPRASVSSSCQNKLPHRASVHEYISVSFLLARNNE